jgi:L-ascorbate 6-phosphate lactonase
LIALIDPYLSDYVEEQLGQRRRVAPPLNLFDVAANVVIISHWHEDHLDRPTCEAVADSNPGVRFVGPPSVIRRLTSWGVEAEHLLVLERGSSVKFSGLEVYAGFARHDPPGALAEDALSLVLVCGEKRIFFTGDTEYDARLRWAAEQRPLDVGLFVIDGSGGNMNDLEAALLAAQLMPRVAIPCHYGMWEDAVYGSEATLDPNRFVEACDRFAGVTGRVLDHGESLSF